MRALRRFVKRAVSWTKRRQEEDRLREEIEEHLALQTAENVRAGLPPEEARRQAVLKFGAVEAMKEGYRDERRLPFLETLVQDMRRSLRRLRKSPAFTITTILTLALGIGATTSIFTLVYAVLLKSLAVANPSELYRLGKESRCCYWEDIARTKSFLWSPMICTNTSDTTPRVLRNWQRSRRVKRCMVSGVQAGQSQPKAFRESSFPAITSRCSVSRRMPAVRLRLATISAELRLSR